MLSNPDGKSAKTSRRGDGGEIPAQSGISARNFQILARVTPRREIVELERKNCGIRKKVYFIDYTV